jgi:hypothetical protein
MTDTSAFCNDIFNFIVVVVYPPHPKETEVMLWQKEVYWEVFLLYIDVGNNSSCDSSVIDVVVVNSH